MSYGTLKWKYEKHQGKGENTSTKILILAMQVYIWCTFFLGFLEKKKSAVLLCTLSLIKVGACFIKSLWYFEKYLRSGEVKLDSGHEGK